MKVFCVGLSKTATTSLTQALRVLGLDAVHWYATKHAFRYLEFNAQSDSASIAEEAEIDIDWALFERHDAFADTPIARIYTALDDRFPDARFILTLRDPERWLKSFADQFAAGGLDPFSSRLHRDLYGTDHFDHALCLDAFQRHRDQVRARFAERPDSLLEMDIGAGDGWAVLCDFLELPRPRQPFPYRFSRGERRQTPIYRLRQALRRRLPRWS
ncbi:MAG TPA: hypothetical protein DDY14_05730 [Chromatiaceae bacterium]|jgi:hypothetical protein|nr:MAG: hypothetical protein N838_00980 [Thiohalocapsa sp. PB-PSB1]QQO55837.1 MAG: hypothetical protein N838_23325 [Thiohalocapsa sp. PB-PSB1]HBG94818.1 hypothetical protein [Chromatiaceae bacterium]HCS89588.1 hypothetical protein [Chromatiaceae bacterium]